MAQAYPKNYIRLADNVLDSMKKSYKIKVIKLETLMLETKKDILYHQKAIAEIEEVEKLRSVIVTFTDDLSEDDQIKVIHKLTTLSELTVGNSYAVERLYSAADLFPTGQLSIEFTNGAKYDIKLTPEYYKEIRDVESDMHTWYRYKSVDVTITPRKTGLTDSQKFVIDSIIQSCVIPSIVTDRKLRSKISQMITDIE